MWCELNHKKLLFSWIWVQTHADFVASARDQASAWGVHASAASCELLRLKPVQFTSRHLLVFIHPLFLPFQNGSLHLILCLRKSRLVLMSDCWASSPERVFPRPFESHSFMQHHFCYWDITGRSTSLSWLRCAQKGSNNLSGMITR